MPLVLTAVVVAVVGAWAAWRWTSTGAYRREDETGTLPPHRWLLVTVPAATAAFAWAAHDEPLAVAVATMLLAPVGATLVAVDADVHRLPNVLTLPSAPIVLALLTVGAATSGQWADLRRAVVAVLVVGGLFVLVSLVLGSRGIGMGDAKLMLSLAPLLGWHGWSTVLVGVYGAFLLGGAVALVLVLTRRAGRATHLAFGPYLLGGAAVALLLA